MSAESPEVTPEPTVAAPEFAGTPVEFTCDSLLPDYTLAADPRGWVLDESFTPAAGSPQERAVALDGIACGYTGSAGETLAVSFAQPTEATLTALIDELSLSSEPTDAFELFPAFFSDGVADVFPYGYWASLSSPAFTSPADAQSLVSMINQATPKS